MDQPFEDVLSMLGIGQSVTLETGSPIYRGPYSSHILHVGDDGVRVAAPMDEGKLVLLPVGTRVTVIADTPVGSVSFESRIVHRTAGRNRSLTLTSPALTPEEDEETDKKVSSIAVSSGKGGVGKSTFVVNLGIALSRLGQKVCIIDGDLGTANADVLLNVTSRYNLAHVIRGERHILEVVAEGPEGLILLPGGSGFQELTVLDDRRFSRLVQQFREIEAYADLILIDTGSGLSPVVTNFIQAANETILITTPEPPAITDCYALIKVLALKGHEAPLRLVVNRAESEAEAAEVGEKMTFASRRFLHTDLSVLGYIAEDGALGRSVKEQKPLLMAEPGSRAAQQISRIGRRLVAEETFEPEIQPQVGFFERMRRLVVKGAARRS